MTIDRPTQAQIPQLRRLWKEAFQDTDDFLDIFFHRAYSSERSRCITQDGTVVAALYWFDCTWKEKKLAYIYAVATDKTCRGQGLCRRLMEDAHHHLKASGYDGCILVPQSDGLFTMYGKFGYRICSYNRKFSCNASDTPISLTQVTPVQYAAARQALLPENAVIQDGVTLEFLSTYARLYAGKELVLAAYPNQEKLMVCELLGDPMAAPKILATLGFREGTFRVPDAQTPFAMYLSLQEDVAAPGYFGLALD